MRKKNYMYRYLYFCRKNELALSGYFRSECKFCMIPLMLENVEMFNNAKEEDKL